MLSLSLSARAYDHKPAGAEIALQQQQMKKIDFTHDVEEGLLYFIGQRGHAYRDAVLAGGCRTEHFVEQQLLTLDFDNGTTVESFLKQCSDYLICPNVIYHTFSHTDGHPRFRAIFVLDKPVESIAVAKALRRCINYLFTEADSVKSIVQLWQGSTKGGVFIENTRLNAGWVFLLAAAFLKRDTAKSNFKRDLKSKLLLADAPRIEEVIKNVASPNNNIEPATFLITLRIANSSDESEIDEKLKAHFDWKAQLEGCRFTRECFEGVYWPTEPEYFYLCMLYKNCKGGQKRLKQLIEDISAKHNYTAAQRQNLLNTLKSAGSSPIRCSTIGCPYQDECGKVTPLQAQPLGIGECYSVATSAPQPLTAAEQQLKGYIVNAFTCDEHTAILSAPCGIGKTEQLIDYIAGQTNKRFLYCTPTHELGREIHARFTGAGVDAALVPELCLDDLEPELREQYQQRLAVGDSTGARAILFQSKNERVRDYWLVTDRFKGNLLQNSVVICTHARSMTKANLYTYDAVIYDEDIFLSSIETVETTASELSSFAPAEFTETVKRVPDGLHDLRPKPRKEIIEFCKGVSSSCSFNMAAVLSAQVLLKDGERLTFGVKRGLPKSIKRVIASATCDDAVARWLLNTDNVKTFKIDSVETVGKLYQRLTQSSRKRLSSDTAQQFEEFTKIAGCENIISFKSLENKVTMQAHFGAVSGIDSMKGRDLVVVGTPRNDPRSDIVFARFCDRTIRADDADSMRMETVVYNGWRFRLFCSSHPTLRQIQLYTINSGLTQAAGRGRILRENCRCFVFSELPLESATLI